MNGKTIDELTAQGAFKTAEDADAAARITAHGFADEMHRLATVFRLDKIAHEGEGAEPAAEEAAEAGEEGLGEDLLALLQELGGL